MSERAVVSGQQPPPQPRPWIAALLPLVAIAAGVVLLLTWRPERVFQIGVPPPEELSIRRIVLVPGEILLEVTNVGPAELTLAQVIVDAAYWTHTVTPARRIPRLGQAEVRVPYPWVQGETHEVKLITSTGLTFTREIPVAVATPQLGWRAAGLFTLMGTYVGVLPVFLGLAFLPFLRRLSPAGIHFLLAVTVGLLFFLAVDALHEALETAGRIPGAYQPFALIAAGVAGSLLALGAAGQRPAGAQSESMGLATSISIGIGLHNLGEGLAVGAAFALGEAALGTMLVLGFALHNTTEGVAIVAPLTRERVQVRRLVWLGAVAGVPTIFGALIGGLVYSEAWALLFLALGTGAILQVLYQVGKYLTRGGSLFSAPNLAGFAAGFLVMFSTGLLVAG